MAGLGEAAVRGATGFGVADVEATGGFGAGVDDVDGAGVTGSFRLCERFLGGAATFDMGSGFGGAGGGAAISAFLGAFAAVGKDGRGGNEGRVGRAVKLGKPGAGSGGGGTAFPFPLSALVDCGLTTSMMTSESSEDETSDKVSSSDGFRVMAGTGKGAGRGGMGRGSGTAFGFGGEALLRFGAFFGTLGIRGKPARRLVAAWNRRDQLELVAVEKDESELWDPRIRLVAFCNSQVDVAIFAQIARGVAGLYDDWELSGGGGAARAKRR